MFIIYVITFLTTILLCVRVTKDYLSPVIFILTDVAFRSLLPIVVGGLYFTTNIVDQRLNISLNIQLIGIFGGFYIFSFIGKRIQINSTKSFYKRPIVPKFLILFFIVGAIVSFQCIFIFGNWSLFAWLENPRQGYLLGRKGVGLFFVLFILFINLAWISLVACPNRFSKVVKFLLALIILYLAYLTGSKRVVVSLFLFYIIYYNIYVQKLNLIQCVAAFVGLSVAFVLYFLAGSGAITDIIGYFHYFFTTQEIYGRLEEGSIKYQWGAINATRIWEFIPRFIYPDKPYVYGGGYVTEIIAPGQVEKGHNLGMLDFTAYYLDFGQFGVLYHSVATGSFAGLIYGLFSKNKNSFFLFLIYLSLYTNILPSSPAPLFFTLLIIFYILYLFYKQFIRSNLKRIKRTI